jgi:hypothetical protein
MMQEKFNPHRENFHGKNDYHSPPWPTPHTQQDKTLQNKWCPNCDKLPRMKFPHSKEGYQQLNVLS